MKRFFSQGNARGWRIVIPMQQQATPSWGKNAVSCFDIYAYRYCPLSPWKIQYANEQASLFGLEIPVYMVAGDCVIDFFSTIAKTRPGRFD